MTSTQKLIAPLAFALLLFGGIAFTGAQSSGEITRTATPITYSTTDDGEQCLSKSQLRKQLRVLRKAGIKENREERRALIKQYRADRKAARGDSEARKEIRAQYREARKEIRAARKALRKIKTLEGYKEKGLLDGEIVPVCK